MRACRPTLAYRSNQEPSLSCSCAARPQKADAPMRPNTLPISHARWVQCAAVGLCGMLFLLFVRRVPRRCNITSVLSSFTARARAPAPAGLMPLSACASNKRQVEGCTRLLQSASIQSRLVVVTVYLGFVFVFDRTIDLLQYHLRECLSANSADIITCTPTPNRSNAPVGVARITPVRDSSRTRHADRRNVVVCS